METKYITIPFDLERAKRISSGEEQGKIVTRDGRSARIVCWDRNDKIYPIVALAKSPDDENEDILFFTNNGYYYLKGETQEDLFLSVPDWNTFKDGDILYAKARNFWFIFIYRNSGFYKTSFYAAIDKDIALCLEETRVANNDEIHELRLATETEKQILIDALKASNDPRTKEYLKRFFPNHSNSEKIGKEYNFEPKQWVICKGGCNNNYAWTLCRFSHIEEGIVAKYVTVGGNYWVECIPYNLQTKHLLGTTEDWKE